MVSGVDPAVIVAVPAGVYAGCAPMVWTPVDGVDAASTGVRRPDDAPDTEPGEALDTR